MFELQNIEELEQWKSCNLDVWDYISNNIKPKIALLSSKLYFPKFIKFNEFYINERNFDEISFKVSYENWINNKNLDEISFEKSWNDVKLYEIFENTVENTPDIIFEQIGKIMEYSWLNCLNYQFPNNIFHTEFRHNDDEYGPVVTAWSSLK